MKKIFFLTVIILGTFNFTFAQLPFGLDKVREVKLLESSRDDVRKIFAEYKSGENEDQYHEDSFYTDDAEIKITYSPAECDDNGEFGSRSVSDGDWNIPEWKATDISINFEGEITFNELKSVLLKLGTKFSKFKREKIYENDDELFLYHNKEMGILIGLQKDAITHISFSPARKYYSLMCSQQAAKKLSKTKSWFTTPLRERTICYLPNIPANTKNLILSLPEITASCPLSDSTQNKSCSSSVKVIAVFTVGQDPEGDVLTYAYTVSGGKITGQGDKVLWDLSDVKPGTYTITAAVDDGCGFCGKSMTKTVVVKECSDCGK